MNAAIHPRGDKNRQSPCRLYGRIPRQFAGTNRSDIDSRPVIQLPAAHGRHMRPQERKDAARRETPPELESRSMRSLPRVSFAPIPGNAPQIETRSLTWLMGPGMPRTGSDLRFCLCHAHTRRSVAPHQSQLPSLNSSTKAQRMLRATTPPAPPGWIAAASAGLSQSWGHSWGVVGALNSGA